MKCLVIDECSGARSQIIGILQAAFDPFEWVEVADAQAWTAALTVPDFDIALSEARLSWIDGLELIRELHAQFPTLPIILCPGDGSEMLAVAAFKAGVTDYLRKEQLESRLIPAVQECLAQNIPGPAAPKTPASPPGNGKYSQLLETNRQLNARIEELCRAEAETRASEEQLRLMADSLPAYIAYIDANERYQFNNAVYEQWYGLNRSQLRGRTLREVIGPRSYERDREYIQAALNGKSVNFEIRITAPNGDERIHNLNFVPHRAADQTVQGFYILITDLTMRKKEEEARLENELKFRCIVEQSGDGIMLLDQDGRIVEWNAAQEKITGLSRDTMLGQTLESINFPIGSKESPAPGSNPHAPENIRRYIETTLQYGPQLRHHTVTRPDGSQRLIQFVTFPLHTAHGIMIGSIARDVTELRKGEAEREQLLIQVQAYAQELHQANQQLQQQNQELTHLSAEYEAEQARLAAVLQQMPAGVVIAEAPSGRTLLINEQMIGLQQNAGSPFPPFPQPPAWAFQQDSRPYTIETWPLNRALQSGETVTHETLEIRLRDGTRRLADVNAAPIHNREGQIVAGVLVIHDVTAHRQAKEERERLLAENRQQRAFLERLVAAAPVGIAVLRGIERRYELVNPWYQRLPGTLRPPESGRLISEVFPAQTQEAMHQQLAAVARSGQVMVIREQQVWDPIRQKFTYWNLEYVPLPTSTLIPEERILILTHDITEEIYARQEIEALALRNEAIMNSMTEGLVILDLQGRLVSMNPVALRIFGFSNLDEVLQQREDLDQWFSPQYLDRRPVPPAETPMSLALQGKTFSNLEMRICRQDTGECWIGSFGGGPVKNKAGETILALYTVRDITAQKVAQQRREQLLSRVKQQHRKLKELALMLDRERQKLQIIMENTPALLAYLDDRFRLVSYNTPYARNAGAGGSELLGRSHFELFPHPENQARFERVLQSGEPLAFHAQQQTLPQDHLGGPTYWDWTLVPIKEADEQVHGLVFSLLDVTEREWSQREREARLSIMNALLRLTQECLAETEIDGLLKKVVEAARQLLGTRIGMARYRTRGAFYRISFCPPAQHCIVRTLNRPPEEDQHLAILWEQDTLWLKGAQVPQTIDFGDLPPDTPVPQELLGARLVRRDGQPGGLILVADKIQGEFKPEDEALLAQLAALASLALQHVEARTEAEQRAEELAAVFSAITDAVIVYDSAGRPLRANPAAQNASGILTPGTDGLQKTLDIRYPDGRALFPENHPTARALQGYPVTDEPFLLTNPWGEQRIVLTSAGPLYEGDRCWGAVLVWHDVTQQEQLLTQLGAERARLKAIIEAAPEGIVVIDNQGRVALANPAAHQLYGSHFHLGEPLQGEIEKVCADPDTGPCIELALNVRLADGSRRNLLANSAPISDANGDNHGAVVIFRDITEHQRLLSQLEDQRLRAEISAHELRLANNLLHALINTLPAGVLISDRTGAVLLSNLAAQELTQNRRMKSRDPALADSGPLLEPLETLPLKAVLEQGQMVKDVQLVIQRPDGTEQVLLAAAAPVRNEADQIVSAVQVFQDITELKRARETLRRYADRLELLHGLDRAILSAPTGEGIAAATLETLRQLVPCQWASVVEFDTARSLARRLARLGPLTTEISEQPLEDLWFRDAVFQGETYFVKDLQQIHPDSDSEVWRWLRNQGIRTFISVPLMIQGTPMGILNLGFDTPAPLSPEYEHFIQEVADELSIGLHQADLREQIHRHTVELEQRVAERTAELQASETRFRTIFEGAAIGIALADMEGRLVESNPALQKMFGADGNALHGQPLARWIQPDSGTGEGDLYQALTAGPDQFHQVERRYQRLNGQTAWANVTLSLIHDFTGKPRYMIGIIEDTTRQKQAQTALIQAEKLATAGKLATTLAHEINNPLQSVIGCLALAEETLGEGGSVEKYLKVASEDLQRAARIVAQLRDLNRQVLPQECKLTQINQLLERVINLSQKQCQDQHVEVLWYPATTLPALYLVPDRISQVFLNLLLNAVEAMPEGGTLEIRTTATATPPGIEITFIDNGVGIPDTVQSNLFDPFYTTKTGGMGIGLFISHNIIQEHGGRIEVKNREIEGTEVRIWLPIEPFILQNL